MGAYLAQLGCFGDVAFQTLKQAAIVGEEGAVAAAAATLERNASGARYRGVGHGSGAVDATLEQRRAAGDGGRATRRAWLMLGAGCEESA